MRDGASPVWRIPAERMEMEWEHIVLLSAQTVDVAQRAWRWSGAAGADEALIDDYHVLKGLPDTSALVQCSACALARSGILDACRLY